MTMRAAVRLLLGLVMLFGAYHSGRIGYYALVHAKQFDEASAAKFARMVPLDATVVSAKRHAGASGPYNSRHLWTVHYDFSVPQANDGKRYTGSFDVRDTNTNEKEFKEGEKVAIYYDPVDPSNNKLKGWYEGEKESNGKYGTSWIGGFFMLVGVLLLVGGALLVPRAIVELLRISGIPRPTGAGPDRR